MLEEDFHKQNTLPDLSEKKHFPTPKQIGPYKVESLLNKGGMSYLYLAFNEKKKPIAIKVLIPKFFKNQEVKERFLKEAEIIQMTNHPNIVKLYAHGEWEKGLYIAMEFIRGVSLRQFIGQRSLSMKKALEIVLQVGYALCHLHTHGVIHRDLKPENILITETGAIKVIDFGIARLSNKEVETRTTKKVMGTPIYMSPEQKKDPESVTYASDIYSLGMITYELLTGRVSYGEVHLSILPKSIRPILEKALQNDPKRRYSDIVDFITEISAQIQEIDAEKKEAVSKEVLDLFLESKRILVGTKPSWPHTEIGIFQKGAEMIYFESFLMKKERMAFVMAKSKTPDPLALLQFRGFFRMAVSAYLTLGKTDQHPIQMLNHINEELIAASIHEKISLNFLMLSADKNILSMISCGDEELIHIPHHSKKIRILKTPNPMLGERNDLSLLETVDNWEVQDTLIIASKKIEESRFNEDFYLITPQHQAEKILDGNGIVLSIRRLF